MAVVKGVNFPSLLFAGFSAGYVMSFVDFYFKGFLGWFSGMMAPLHGGMWNQFVGHQIDSILFGWVYVAFVKKFLPGAGWLKGGIFGLILAVAVLIASMIGAAGGAGMMKMMGSMPQSAMVGFFASHIIYGVVLGTLYSDD